MKCYEFKSNARINKEYLYVIKENISVVHPVYRNDPLNMYLILGSHSA